MDSIGIPARRAEFHNTKDNVANAAAEDSDDEYVLASESSPGHVRRPNALRHGYTDSDWIPTTIPQFHKVPRFPEAIIDIDSDDDDVVIVSESSPDPSRVFKAPCIPEPTVDDDSDDDDVVIISESFPGSSKVRKQFRDAKVGSDDNYFNMLSCPCGGHYKKCTHCGFQFAESCIRWWFLAAKKHFGCCPMCNTRAVIHDIRPFFAMAMDILNKAERETVLKELQYINDDGTMLTLSLKGYPLFFLKDGREFYDLVREVHDIRVRMAPETVLSGLINTEPGAEQLPTNPLQGIVQNGRSCLFTLENVEVIDIPGSRNVMGYSEILNLLTVSQRSVYDFFAGFGVKLIDTERMQAVQFIPAHRKPISAMSYSTYFTPPLLLSVSVDGTARLLDVGGNANPVAATMNTDVPLVSCCWDATSPHLVHVGSEGGMIMVFDIRRTSEVLFRRKARDDSPIISLVSIPPEPGRSLPRGGLISSQAFNVDILENGMIMANRLNFNVPLNFIQYEPTNKFFLIAAKNDYKYPFERFISCERAHESPRTYMNGITSALSICKRPLREFLGGTSRRLRSRPCIFPIENDLLISSYQYSKNDVKFWSVGSGQCIASIPATDRVIDTCPFKVNEETYVALLTSKILSLYKYRHN